MPDCKYCEDSFTTEKAYLTHLEDEHQGEIGRLDRRRLDQRNGDGDEGLDYGTIAWGALLVGVLGVIVTVTVLRAFGSGGSSPAAAQQPTDLWSVHYHGTIDVVIEGEEIDFSQSEYQLQADAFHFEGGGGTR
jgi:hypothetical protein